MRNLRLCVCTALCALLFSAAPAGALTYTVQDISPADCDPCSGVAINNNGQYVLGNGTQFGIGGGTQAFAWITPYPAGGIVAFNDAGQILSSTGNAQAFFWSKETGYVAIGSPTADQVQVVGLDNSGRVAGSTRAAADTSAAYRQVLWTPQTKQFTDASALCGAGTTLAAMDNAGDIACTTGSGNDRKAYVYATDAGGKAVTTALPSIAPNTIRGLASPNTVMLQGNPYAAVMGPLAGAWKPVTPPPGGGRVGLAHINGAGQIVGSYQAPNLRGGYTAFVWDPVDGAVNLTAAMAPGSPFTSLGYAAWINESGQIVGSGTTTDGKNHAFLATPDRSALKNGVDVVISSATGAGYVNALTGTYFPLTAKPASQCAAGNFDGDAIDDIVCVFPAEQGVQVQNTSTGQWGSMSATNPEWFTIGDMNGDGRDDLIGTWKDAGAVYWRNSITGEWKRLSATPALMVAVGNFDGDSKADLLGVWDDNPGAWVWNSKDGSWGRVADTNPKAIAVGDMNGDGRDDFIGSWDDSHGVYWRDSITGAWTRLSDTPADKIAVGDLDGDGKADLIGIWPDKPGVRALLSSTGQWVTLYGGNAASVSVGTLHR